MTIVVSRGAGVQVPDLRGKPIAEAQSEVDALGLRVDLLHEFGEEEPGTVIRSDPAAGELVEEDGAVTLVVSSGAGVKVPDLRGQPAAAAKSGLTALGFHVDQLLEVSDQVEGTVIRSDPAAGELVASGGLVTIVVSKGIEIVDDEPVGP